MKQMELQLQATASAHASSTNTPVAPTHDVDPTITSMQLQQAVQVLLAHQSLTATHTSELV